MPTARATTSFDFKVHDGTEYSAAANTITVDVTAVQDAPTAADKTVTTNEDTAYTFAPLTSDSRDVDAGDSLTKIQITSLESNGTLKLSGADVTLNQEILVADIGNLVFTPAQDANGARATTPSTSRCTTAPSTRSLPTPSRWT